MVAATARAVSRLDDLVARAGLKTLSRPSAARSPSMPGEGTFLDAGLPLAGQLGGGKLRRDSC
jgi:hypothetical protein